MQRLQCRYQRSAVVAALAYAAFVRHAQAQAPATPAPDESSPAAVAVPRGLGLSPEAPPVPPAPGGRAPSFGAPTPAGDQPLFRFGGNLYAWEAVGIGRAPTVGDK